MLLLVAHGDIPCPFKIHIADWVTLVDSSLADFGSSMVDNLLEPDLYSNFGVRHGFARFGTYSVLAVGPANWMAGCMYSVAPAVSLPDRAPLENPVACLLLVGQDMRLRSSVDFQQEFDTAAVVQLHFHTVGCLRSLKAFGFLGYLPPYFPTAGARPPRQAIFLCWLYEHMYMQGFHIFWIGRNTCITLGGKVCTFFGNTHTFLGHFESNVDRRVDGPYRNFCHLFSFCLKYHAGSNF